MGLEIRLQQLSYDHLSLVPYDLSEIGNVEEKGGRDCIEGLVGRFLKGIEKQHPNVLYYTCV